MLLVAAVSTSQAANGLLRSSRSIKQAPVDDKTVSPSAGGFLPSDRCSSGLIIGMAPCKEQTLRMVSVTPCIACTSKYLIAALTAPSHLDAYFQVKCQHSTADLQCKHGPAACRQRMSWSRHTYTVVGLARRLCGLHHDDLPLRCMDPTQGRPLRECLGLRTG